MITRMTINGVEIPQQLALTVAIELDGTTELGPVQLDVSGGKLIADRRLISHTGEIQVLHALFGLTGLTADRNGERWHVLQLLQDGQISVAKAAEALDEILEGKSPILPATISRGGD